MSNRKNLIRYDIIGKNYYNEPYMSSGEIEHSKLLIAKPLLVEIDSLGIWGKEIKFARLYTYDYIENKDIMSVLAEMKLNDFITIDEMKFYKNTKTMNINEI